MCCVAGEENSSVQGVLLGSGLFDGTIRIGSEELYVEPAQNYFATTPDFHSVIYRLSDVHYPETNRTCVAAPPPTKLRHHHHHHKSHRFHNRVPSEEARETRRTPGQADGVRQNASLRRSDAGAPHSGGELRRDPLLSRLSHPGEQRHPPGFPGDHAGGVLETGPSRMFVEGMIRDEGPQSESPVEPEGGRRHLYWRDLDSLHYTESGGGSSSEPYGVRSVQRTQWPEEGAGGRRGSVAVDRRKSTCLLYLQADHLFYRRLGGEEACIDAMTRHVQRVNSIYRNTGTVTE